MPPKTSNGEHTGKRPGIAGIGQGSNQPQACRVISLLAARRERGRRRKRANADPRQQENWIAAIVLAILFLLGFWLFNEIGKSTRMETCIEAGYRNCFAQQP